MKKLCFRILTITTLATVLLLFGSCTPGTASVKDTDEDLSGNYPHVVGFTITNHTDKDLNIAKITRYTHFNAISDTIWDAPTERSRVENSAVPQTTVVHANDTTGVRFIFKYETAFMSDGGAWLMLDCSYTDDGIKLPYVGTVSGEIVTMKKDAPHQTDGVLFGCFSADCTLDFRKDSDEYILCIVK
ncbi:MAG: hypothetical protein J6I73_05825 [Treponema sp.]|nr:hypothetical protein [Treponema sp.]